MSLTPAQEVIVRTWFNLINEADVLDHMVSVEDARYSATDYAVAKRLDLPVETVGEALVAAGKRPPVWWVG